MKQSAQTKKIYFTESKTVAVLTLFQVAQPGKSKVTFYGLLNQSYLKSRKMTINTAFQS